MRHNKFFILISLTTLLLVGCKSDIDLKNIDGTTEVEMGLGFPIGTMQARLEDFLGPELGGNMYIDAGTLIYRDTIHVHKNFHKIDLAEYQSSVSNTFSMYDVFPGNHITGNNTQQCIDFPFTIKLNNINTNLADARFDSIQINKSVHTNTFNVSNLALNWAWIDRIELGLGKEFSRKAGKRITLYNRVTDRNTYSSFGTEIPVDINAFTVCLMKDRNRIGEVINEVGYVLYVYFTVPTGQNLDIPANATFDYTMQIDYLKYDAIWGMFAPSKEMANSDIMVIKDHWPVWSKFKEAKLPFHNPEIDLQVKTEIAGHLVFDGEYLYVKSLETGDSVFAAFDENGTHSYQRIIPDEEVLALNSPIHSVLTDYTYFTKETHQGQIDKLFAIRPDIIGYKFFVDFYQPDVYPQGRLTENTDIDIYAVARLPFVFNPDTKITFSDTIENIDITVDLLDSLSQTEDLIDTIETTTIKLALFARNTLPLEIKGIIRFMDENGREVMEDMGGTLRPFQITEDTLRFAAPEFGKVEGQTIMTKAGESTIIISIDKEHFALLSKVKSIILEAVIDDEAIQRAQAKNPNLSIYPIRITDEQNIRIKMGLAADVKAVLDFTNAFTNEDK